MQQTISRALPIAARKSIETVLESVQTRTEDTKTMSEICFGEIMQNRQFFFTIPRDLGYVRIPNAYITSSIINTMVTRGTVIIQININLTCCRPANF